MPPIQALKVDVSEIHNVESTGFRNPLVEDVNATLRISRNLGDNLGNDNGVLVGAFLVPAHHFCPTVLQGSGRTFLMIEASSRYF